ncbi:MAG: CapA family protein [Candidatus Edwardsbacteria bacterium]
MMITFRLLPFLIGSSGLLCPQILQTQTPLSVPAETTSITIIAVGDIIPHQSLLNAGFRADSNKYNFDSFFEPVASFIEKADIAVGNLETTLAGEENGSYTGYPLFNSPEALAASLKKASFDILFTANNHSLDRGAVGVKKTLDYLDHFQLKHTGTARSVEEQSTPFLIEVNGIKFAFLAYTTLLNETKLLTKEDFLVNLFSEDKLKEAIKRSQKVGADFIVVAIHWGEEYTLYPSSAQRKLAKQIISWGANLILGTHPHVLQPAEKIVLKNTSGDTLHQGWVFYSLGNFLSGQRKKYRDEGIILKITLKKDSSIGRILWDKIGYIPTWVQSGKNQDAKRYYRILSVEKALKDYQNEADSLLAKQDYKRLKEIWQEMPQKMKAIERCSIKDETTN